MLKELNNSKLPDELKFFWGVVLIEVMNIYFMQCKTGMLNESNEHFLDYLSSRFAQEVLSKNKMKIHLETGSIYDDNLNMREHLQLHASQQDKVKKILDFDLHINDDFEFYLNEIIADDDELIWILLHI